MTSSTTVRLPLTAAQSGIWFAQQLHQDSAVFNTGEYVEISGPVDVDRFTAALHQLVVEAECLRLRFADDGDGPYAELTEPDWTLRVTDLRNEPDPRGAAVTAMRANMAIPRDLAVDMLFDFELFRIGDQNYLWFYTYHHAAVDGFTVAMLTRRAAEVYTALGKDTEATGNPFPPLTELLTLEAHYREGNTYTADAEYWAQVLADRTQPVTLAHSSPVPARDLVRRTEFLDPVAAERLWNLAREAGVSLPPAIMATVAMYLHKMTGRTDILLGVPVSTRLGKLARSVPGMVSNVVPLRLSVRTDATVGDFMEHVAAELREAMRHQRYRFEDLRRDLRLVGSEERIVGPEVNIMMFDYDLSFDGRRAVVHNLSIGPSDDLSFIFYQRSDGRGLQLDFDANPELYGDEELAAHQRRFLDFLRLIDSRPDQPIDALDVLTSGERELVIDTYNGTAHKVPSDTLTDLLNAAAEATPDATSVVFEGRELSYRELHERANRLAGHLTACGVGPESVVALAIPRSVELMVALLGVLKSGAAYLPIDPGYPAERIAFMVTDACPALLLTTSVTSGSLPSDLPTDVLALDTPVAEELLAGYSAAKPPDPGLRDGHPAYVIYTSGSTGRPKGVVVPHRGIVNRLCWMQSQYELSKQDVVLQKTPSGFDVSVWEFFWPLIQSATLVLARPDGHRDPAYLADLIASEKVTTVHFVPSMLRAFLAEPAAASCGGLRRVMCSGEALPREVLQGFLDLFEDHGTELHNLYGPTEASVDVTAWECERGSGAVPIGTPVWNTQTYVLDAELRPVARGVSGELYLAGSQLARGYLGRASLTAERFVADPFGEPGSRMYRTGDIAYWDERGRLGYVGRADDQVKVRGLRVELGEVSAALASHSSVGQAETVLLSEPYGNEHIVGYVVPDDASNPPSEQVLRTYLATRLPEYMVPTAFVVVGDFPLTPNGKLDRKALPPPDFSAKVVGEVPRNPQEEMLCGLFADVLELRRVGIRDNFFEIGGHSLLATRLVNGIRETFGVPLTIRGLFEAPTVAALAETISNGGESGSPLDVLLPLRPYGDAPALFCLHPAGGLSWCYSGLINHLAPEIPVYGLQARGLDSTEPLAATIYEMAEDYLEQIRAVQPDGPYHLVGYSSGGILAHVLATMLTERGAEVGVVTVLDTYPGQTLAELGEQEVMADLLGWVGYDRRYLGRKRLRFSDVVKILRKLGSSLASLEERHVGAISRIYANCRELMHEFRPQLYHGDIVVVVAAIDKIDISPTPATWEPYVGGEVRVRTIDYRHNDLMKPGPLAEIGQILATELNTYESHRKERV